MILETDLPPVGKISNIRIRRTSLFFKISLIGYLHYIISKAKCKDCGVGHWTVSCPRKNETVSGSLSGDCILIEKFIIKTDEPEPEEQLVLLEKMKEDWRN